MGLTASPASDISEDGTYDRVMGLAQTLDAKYYMIDEEDVEVQKVRQAMLFCALLHWE